MITQDPWKVHEKSKIDGEYEIYTGPSWEEADAHIASVAGGLGFYDEGGEDYGCCESKTNAELMRAAPELLKLLKKAREAMPIYYTDSKDEKLEKEIDELIQKIEGA